VIDVTEVRIRRLEGTGRTKAFASITLDDQFVVHDLRVVAGNDGLFVAMPSRRLGNGSYKDVAHPITPQFRIAVEGAVLSAFNRPGEEGRRGG